MVVMTRYPAAGTWCFSYIISLNPRRLPARWEVGPEIVALPKAAAQQRSEPVPPNPEGAALPPPSLGGTGLQPPSEAVTQNLRL